MNLTGSIGGSYLRITQNGITLFTSSNVGPSPTYTLVTDYFRPPYGSTYPVIFVFYSPTSGGSVSWNSFTLERIKGKVNAGLGEMTIETAPTVATSVTNKYYVDTAVAGAGSSLLASANTWTGSSNRFNNLVTFGGSVGIGTTNPSTLFHLYGGAQNTEQRICSNDGYITRLGMYEEAVGSTWGGFIQYNGNNDNLELGHKRSGTDTTEMVITNGGKMGIGTTAPGCKLHVLTGGTYSPFSPDAITMSTNGGGAYMICNNGTHTAFLGADGSNYGMVGTITNSDFVVRSNNIERIRFSTGGDITTTNNFTTSAGSIKAGGDPKGSVSLTPGDSSHSGYINFYYTDSIRAGYIGFADSNTLYISTENGRKLFLACPSGIYTGGNFIADCFTKQVYRNVFAWGGGLRLYNAFFRNNANSNINIWGYVTGYCGSAQTLSLNVAVYAQNTGVWYYLGPSYFTNVTYNHAPYPFSCQFNGATSSTTGWFDIYLSNNGGFITDGNDYVCLNTTISPTTNY
jgi:hypothetical protein